MGRAATLWPGGTMPLTVTPSPGSAVPPSNWRRAMTTLSAGWIRMTGSSMREGSVVDQRRVPGMHSLALLAQAVDGQAHFIARLQVDRWLHAEPHAGRCAGADEVAGVQRHETADVADECGHAEHHRPGVAVLHALAVHVQPQAEVLRIAHLVGADEPGPDRSEGVAALALVPLAARALQLVLPFRHVVDDAVAGHVLQ